MTCADVDLKEYVLGESGRGERLRVEQHVAVCAGCAEELERLRVAQSMLAALPEEEPPRRIAFVSDKVFEPGWWQRFWRHGPRVAFAAAAMLSAAILVHAFTRPPVIVNQPAPAVTAAADPARIEQEIARRVEAALAASEARQAARVDAAIKDARQSWDLDRKAELMAVEENFNLLRKQMAQMVRMSYLASNEAGGAR